MVLRLPWILWTRNMSASFRRSFDSSEGWAIENRSPLTCRVEVGVLARERAQPGLAGARPCPPPAAPSRHLLPLRTPVAAARFSRMLGSRGPVCRAWGPEQS